ncbi:hypothetical protein [Accumulibacter sp.]|uniref:hypothetical protein n=1 Tax=Accumulibacter sp. TaxID=2053492 RepID=UPI00261872C8|nr:hypothetical protein [Accumulibacter sp.]
MPGNLYWKDLSVGLHLAGANGATSFPDVKGHTFTRTGNVVISTAQSRFAGEGSAYFPGGTNDLLKCAAHADFGNATNSLSIAWSMYPLALPAAGTACRLIMIGANGSLGTFTLHFDSLGYMGGYLAASGYNSFFGGPGAVVLNQWQDFELSVFNRSAFLLKDRGLIASLSNLDMPSGNFPKRIQIGGDDSGFASVDARYNGYLSEVQIQVYAGRLPSPAAPTGPFADSLGLGLARSAAPTPFALLRQTPPAHRILRQGTPRLMLDTDNGGHGRVIGTTKNVGTPNYPVARRVRLLRKRDGAVVREVWSDAAGNYQFTQVRHDLDYVVMAHDHTGLYNAVVADTVTPELMP